MQLSRSMHHRYINDILTALSTYSNIVGHVHGPTLRRPPYCVHKYIMPRTIRTRGSVAILAKTEIPGGLPALCIATCGLRKYYIANLANFPIHKSNSKQ